MNYSTLQEAYNIDTFERKSRPSNKSNKSNGSSTSPSNTNPSNTSPSFVETSKLALSSNKLSDYPNNHGSSCSPLQAPTYNIPISNECKREHDEAMNVYTNANNNMNNMMNNIPTGINNNNSAGNGVNGVNSVNASNTNNNNNLQISQSPTSSSQTPLLPSQNLFNSLKSSDNVMPYYDEDLEQYFNISNLNDEVKYNSNSYMPNTNKQPYTNNDTSEYTNSNAVLKNGNNLLNNSSYNLTPEEKKSADEAIAYLKRIEDKINSGSMNSSGYNKTSIADPVIPPVNTGPGGFKTPDKPIEKPADKPVEKTAEKLADKAAEKSDNNYIYNAIFNISILLIIGIAIILLCDQMVELSIQIGMKRVVNILEPFIKANAAAAAAAAQAQ